VKEDDVVAEETVKGVVDVAVRVLVEKHAGR
jgi:hypothetical protein